MVRNYWIKSDFQKPIPNFLFMIVYWVFGILALVLIECSKQMSPKFSRAYQKWWCNVGIETQRMNGVKLCQVVGLGGNEGRYC